MAYNSIENELFNSMYNDSFDQYSNVLSESYVSLNQLNSIEPISETDDDVRLIVNNYNYTHIAGISENNTKLPASSQQFFDRFDTNKHSTNEFNYNPNLDDDLKILNEILRKEEIEQNSHYIEFLIPDVEKLIEELKTGSVEMDLQPQATDTDCVQQVNVQVQLNEPQPSTSRQANEAETQCVQVNQHDRVITNVQHQNGSHDQVKDFQIPHPSLFHNKLSTFSEKTDKKVLKHIKRLKSNQNKANKLQ